MQISQRQILLIDEHLDTCEMMTQWFRSLNYTLTAAQTMAEGWRLVQRQPFDLCLLETRLSDGTGYELCRRIRTLAPDLPIVFYTTAAREKDRQQGMIAGAHAYLVKPNDFERIPEVINGLIAEVGAPQVDAPFLFERGNSDKEQNCPISDSILFRMS